MKAISNEAVSPIPKFSPPPPPKINFLSFRIAHAQKQKPVHTYNQFLAKQMRQAAVSFAWISHQNCQAGHTAVHSCLRLITSACVGAGSSCNISCQRTHNATLMVMISVCSSSDRQETNVTAMVPNQSPSPEMSTRQCQHCNSNQAKFCSQYSQVL